MRKAVSFLMMGLLLSVAVAGQAGESKAGEDSRYPVTLTPAEALAQKQQMQDSLAALRQILVALADKDYAAVEKAVPALGHSTVASAQQVVTTTVYRKMETQFQESAAKIVAAARSRDESAVLRELGATTGWCQSCHAALRQEVVPAEPEQAPKAK